MAFTDLITIVDGQDNIIGSRRRDSVGTGDLWRVAALWVRNDSGDVLLAKRSSTKTRFPDCWGPAAAGTVEYGESYAENITKEAFEELGLEGEVFQTGDKVGPNERSPFFCQWFHLKLHTRQTSAFVLQPSEVDSVSWVPFTDLLRDVSSRPGRYVPALRDPELVRRIHHQLP